MFKDLLLAFYGWYEGQKGTRRYKEVRPQHSTQAKLELIINSGFRIIIYCDQINYECTYKNRLIPNKRLPVYHIYSVCTGNVPEKIKSLFSKEITIGPVLCNLLPAELQKKAAISVYVDILRDNIKDK